MRLAWIAIAFTLPAFAGKTSYDLKLDITHNGEKFSSPQVVIKEGETMTLFQESGKEEKFIQVDTDRAMGFLKLKMAIGKIDEEGNRHVLARPEIMVEENRRSSLTVEEESGQSKLSVSALATQREL